MNWGRVCFPTREGANKAVEVLSMRDAIVRMSGLSPQEFVAQGKSRHFTEPYDDRSHRNADGPIPKYTLTYELDHNERPTNIQVEVTE